MQSGSSNGADITLLGPQLRRPSLSSVLQRFSPQLPLCVITAGWQDEEGQLEELAGLDGWLTDLTVYQRSEALLTDDDALAQSHRERQATLQELQRLYRLRLQYAQQAVEELQTSSARPALLSEQLSAARTSLRLLDRQQCRLIRRTHEQFAANCAPGHHPLLDQQRGELAELINASQAVLIAGGNIATLISRMRLFDLASLLAGKPLIVWSAGAMLLTDTIVVFHDYPPQGAGHAEILDTGLGLLHNWIVLPHAHSRLRLQDRQRVADLATRFATARCITLDEGAELVLRNNELQSVQQVQQLARSGRLLPLEVS